MQKRFAQFLGALGLFAFLVFPAIASAQPAGSATYEIGKQLSAAAGKDGAAVGDPVDPRVIVSVIVRVALTLVGTVLFVLMVYSGILWATAGGNEEQVTTAKGTIRNATIGLILVIGAYGITILATNLAVGRPLSVGVRNGPTLEGALQSCIRGEGCY